MNITKDELIRKITGTLIGQFENDQLRIIENTLYIELYDYELYKIEKSWL